MNESPNAQTEGAIESRKDKIANKFDKSQDVLLSNPDEFSPCSISKKSLERDLENSLEKLLEGISQTITSSSLLLATKIGNNESGITDDEGVNEKVIELKDGYSELSLVAKKSYQALLLLGKSIELGVAQNTTNDLNLDRSSKDGILSNEKREKLCDIGRRIWMTIRSNPEAFRDHIVPPKTKDKNPENNKHTSNGDDTWQRHRAAASGYIRTIAARLILIKYIHTKGNMHPEIFQDSAKEGTGRAKHFSVEASASNSELEFGQKSFSRGGKSILSFALDPPSSYGILSLAVSFWDALAERASLNSNGTVSTTHVAKEIQKAAQLAKNGLEEAFDSLILLPDAASLLVVDEDEHDTKHTQNEKTKANNEIQDLNGISEEDISLKIGSSEHVVNLLHQIENFVMQRCASFGDSCIVTDQNSGISYLHLQRFLPCLARTSFKHGNRFARLSEYDHSRNCLRITLMATNECIGGIRKHSSSSTKENKNSVFKVHEQEMIIVSKESFYVLAHACQSLGQLIEANKCLDKIGSYIEEQSKYNDTLFSDTMKRVSGCNGKDSLEASSDLVGMVGPKQQDKADIIGRAQTARAKSKHQELFERANLTFCRIMLKNQTPTNGISDDIELAIDVYIRDLASMSTKFSGDNKIELTKSSSSSNDILFNLACTAARQVCVRRLQSDKSISSNNISIGKETDKTYDILLSFYPKGHVKSYIIVLDNMCAILTAIKVLREDNSSFSTRMSMLDVMCLQIASDFIQNILTDPKQTSTNTTILGDDPFDREVLILKRAQDQFSHAVCLYRALDDGHEVCAKWADLLLKVLTRLNIMQSLDDISHMSSSQKGKIEGISDEVISEVMSVKAFSLTMSGSPEAGINCARAAWQKGLKKPNVQTLIVLIHCAPAESILMELDNAIPSMIPKKCDSTGIDFKSPKVDELICAFPTMCKSSTGKSDIAVLGIQYLWISMLSKCFLYRGVFEPNQTAPPGNTSLFCILRSYLLNFEKLIENCTDCIPREPTEQMNKILDLILKLIKKVRDKKIITFQESDKGPSLPRKHKKQRTKYENKDILLEKRDREESTSDLTSYNLIWDVEQTKNNIGDQIGCVCIAEQVWNIAIQVMSINGKEDNDVDDISRIYASIFFAKAHDFALLSEEEDGLALSKPYLDCDMKVSSLSEITILTPSFHFHSQNKDEVKSVSDLSSEFSAQCLLMSAANIVDHVYFSSLNLQRSSSDNNNEHQETKMQLKKGLLRLRTCVLEFQLNHSEKDEPDGFLGNAIGMIAWLTLRCLAELSDDEACLHCLTKDGLLEQLCKSTIGKKSLGLQVDDGSSDPSIVAHIYLCYKRTKKNNMPQSAAELLKCCAQEMPNRGMQCLHLGGDTSPRSLGEIQRDLMRISTTVPETIYIFEKIESLLEKPMKNCNPESGNITNKVWYIEEEIDYFTIEAYNKGLNLTFLGDIANAERLLICALNLLPWCGKEVQSHTSDMNKAYQGVLNKKNDLPASTFNVLSLFGGVVPKVCTSSSINKMK